MRPDRLTRRQLNRATLARQLLLERSDLSVIAAVENLIGLQSQAPLAHYVGLRSRLRTPRLTSSPWFRFRRAASGESGGRCVGRPIVAGSVWTPTHRPTSTR